MKNILELTKEEILQSIEKKREELFEEKMKKATNELKDRTGISKIKKEIARLLTAFNIKRSEQ